MLRKKNEIRFLEWLSEEYTKRVGYGVRNIDNCPFLTTYSVEHLPDWLYSVHNGVAKSHVIHWAKELESKGMIRFAENGYEFFFTKAGYESVQRNCFQKLIVWLNNNPGALSALALLISIGSFIVAFFALYK